MNPLWKASNKEQVGTPQVLSPYLLRSFKKRAVAYTTAELTQTKSPTSPQPTIQCLNPSPPLPNPLMAMMDQLLKCPSSAPLRAPPQIALRHIANSLPPPSPLCTHARRRRAASCSCLAPATRAPARCCLSRRCPRTSPGSCAGCCPTQSSPATPAGRGWVGALLRPRLLWWPAAGGLLVGHLVRWSMVGQVSGMRRGLSGRRTAALDRLLALSARALHREFGTRALPSAQVQWVL